MFITNFINLLVEEKLALYLLLKIMYRDNSIVPEVVDECLLSLKKILSGPKTYLKNILENIITLIAHNRERGREAFIEINKVFLRILYLIRNRKENLSLLLQCMTVLRAQHL